MRSRLLVEYCTAWLRVILGLVKRAKVVRADAERARNPAQALLRICCETYLRLPFFVFRAEPALNLEMTHGDRLGNSWFSIWQLQLRL